MIEIPMNSEAGVHLSKVIDHPNTHKVSFEVYPNGVTIKRNEGQWTAILSVSEDA